MSPQDADRVFEYEGREGVLWRGRVFKQSGAASVARSSQGGGKKFWGARLYVSRRLTSSDGERERDCDVVEVDGERLAESWAEFMSKSF